MDAKIIKIENGYNGKGGLTGKVVVIECIECGAEKTLPFSKIKNGGGRFCSNKCYHFNLAKRTKHLSPKWQGGRVKMLGYWHIKQDDGSYKREHVIIMENKIGRRLEPNECIHHINGNGYDNREENLQLMTKSEHHKLHYKYFQKNNKGQVIKSEYPKEFL